jgi:ubiquinone/menaquinone biosynthesis C-methylase UbiE
MSDFAWVLAADVRGARMSTDHVSTQYDAIAREYQATKESPLRQHIEAYSFFRMLGDLQGLDVLDLACGEGFYTRCIAAAGAGKVVGVDISQEMIALAEEIELQKQQGISYHCADVASLPDLGSFDVVSAAYLLHYAPDVDALQSMCKRIAAHLKPGGRLVSINENPQQTAADMAGYTQYGFNKTLTPPLQDEALLTYAMVSGRQMIRFDVHYYTRETYERVLQQAGFSNISWVPLQLDPAGAEKYGDSYWQEYLQNPPVTGLVCTL